MIQIIPTLFSTSEAEYKIRIDKLNISSFPKDGWVQFDLMDGKFVPRTGISLEIIKKYPIPYKKEAQLMVIDPEEWIDGLVELSVDRIIFPIEIDKDILEFINQIKSSKIEVGLSLNPESSTEMLDAYLNLVDAVLLMGVKPGFEHQRLDPATIEKIKRIKNKALPLKIGVDGGVNDKNVGELVNAGVDYVAIGSYLFSGNFDENIGRIKESANG